jgi:hypothetical protein
VPPDEDIAVKRLWQRRVPRALSHSLGASHVGVGEAGGAVGSGRMLESEVDYQAQYSWGREWQFGLRLRGSIPC